ncbi:hypothetical protein D3C84_870090 [compost metagenome]
MRLITMLDKGFQRGDIGAVVTRSQFDVRQLCTAAAPIRQESFFDAIGPRQRIQHADLAGQTGQGGIEFRQGQGGRRNLPGSRD